MKRQKLVGLTLTGTITLWLYPIPIFGLNRRTSQPAATDTAVDKLHNAFVAAYEKIVSYFGLLYFATVLDPRLKLDYYEVYERQDMFDVVDKGFKSDY